MPWTPAALLSPPAPVLARAPADWREDLAVLEAEDAFSLAVLGGRAAATPGAAFCFGYQAALRALLPDAMSGQLGALCATESGGNHPRAIQTTLQDGVLTGEKAFVTLGPFAEVLVVVATTGLDPAGRPRLVACVVDAGAQGVGVTAMPPLPFVPDVPHGTLSLDGVRPDVVLPGDGYLTVLKPFRTIEDIHVHAALSAWMLGVAADAGWPADVTESLLAGIAALSVAAALDPSDPGTHRLLGGALSDLDLLLQRIEPLWDAAPTATRDLWRRDRELMRIASAARQARLDKARAATTGGPHAR